MRLFAKEGEYSPTAEDLRKARGLTGCGLIEAKRALEYCHGDMDKLTPWLKEFGQVNAWCPRCLSENVFCTRKTAERNTCIKCDTECIPLEQHILRRRWEGRIAGILLSADCAVSAQAVRSIVELIEDEGSLGDIAEYLCPAEVSE